MSCHGVSNPATVSALTNYNGVAAYLATGDTTAYNNNTSCCFAYIQETPSSEDNKLSSQRNSQVTPSTVALSDNTSFQFCSQLTSNISYMIFNGTSTSRLGGSGNFGSTGVYYLHALPASGAGADQWLGWSAEFIFTTALASGDTTLIRSSQKVFYGTT
jgi:hypothetical protein